MRFSSACLYLLISIYSLTSLAQVNQFNSHTQNIDLPCNQPIPYLEFELTDQFRLENSFMLLWASIVAEEFNRNSMKKAVKEWGFDKVQLLGKPLRGAFGYMAANDDIVLLSFRGTNSLEEIIKDALFLHKSAKSLGVDGSVHTGMVMHFQKLEKMIMPTLEKWNINKEKPIILTGHSLGAAMAAISGAYLENKGYNVLHVYNSAQPVMGDKLFQQSIDEAIGGKYARLLIDEDLVPNIPPAVESADTITSLLPGWMFILKNQVRSFIENINYGGHVGRSLSITQENKFNITRSSERERADKYWKAINKEIRDIRSLGDFKNLITSHTGEHPPKVYMCRFLKAYNNRL